MMYFNQWKLIGMSVCYAKGTILKKLISVSVHFSLGKYRLILFEHISYSEENECFIHCSFLSCKYSFILDTI